jgi:hypothetical protein
MVIEVLLGCQTAPRRRGKDTVKHSQPKTRGLQAMMQVLRDAGLFDENNWMVDAR